MLILGLRTLSIRWPTWAEELRPWVLSRRLAFLEESGRWRAVETIRWLRPLRSGHIERQSATERATNTPHYKKRSIRYKSEKQRNAHFCTGRLPCKLRYCTL